MRVEKTQTQRCSQEGPGRETAVPILLFDIATETFLALSVCLRYNKLEVFSWEKHLIN